MEKEVKSIIRLLKNKKLNAFAIPEKYQSSPEIIAAERKIGLRKYRNMGFDIIWDCFFVEEYLSAGPYTKSVLSRFNDFQSFFSFVEGNIYKKSCYYQIDPSRIPPTFGFDKLPTKKCLISKTIKDYTSTLSKNEQIPLSGILRYKEYKYYENEQFVVFQGWYNSDNKLVKYYQHEFLHFFDFVAFLKGDLSNADLLCCKGMKNLRDISKINFSNARLTSDVCDALNIPYEKFEIKESELTIDAETRKNEIETLSILNASREEAPLKSTKSLYPSHAPLHSIERRVYYITDLHLPENISRQRIKSKNDITFAIYEIVDKLIDDPNHPPISNNDIILIGGDIAKSIEYPYFSVFVKVLKNKLRTKHSNPIVTFVLGNHEYLAFPSASSEEVTGYYKTIVQNAGMFLLHNSLLYINDSLSVCQISANDILSLDDAEIQKRVRQARVILFGGTAYYHTDGFNEIYNKVARSLNKQKVIVLTHTPKEEWSTENLYHSTFVYVSGHTHKNFFYDDGETRIYADNQIGTNNNNPRLKWFTIDTDYDVFMNYSDGIHEISIIDYKDFLRGKNIGMQLNWVPNRLYMLKKQGYYCFLHQSKDGTLSILNGGVRKNQKIKKIEYYYDNMDAAITILKRPLDEYTKVQEAISSEVKKLGGAGTIHGCIIDVDKFNHIFINPINGEMGVYWAENIIFKIVYPSIPALLKEQRPDLFLEYQRILNESDEELIYLTATNPLAQQPQLYLDTSMYRASREIKKAQGLYYNILRIWPEIDFSKSENRNKGLLSGKQ